MYSWHVCRDLLDVPIGIGCEPSVMSSAKWYASEQPNGGTAEQLKSKVRGDSKVSAVRVRAGSVSPFKGVMHP